MAKFAVLNFALFAKHLRTSLPYRRQISSTRRLLSQEWQQEGVAGSNLPFSIKNKYLFTLMMIVYMGSGLNAPFLIMRRKLKQDSAPTPEPPQEQSLTTIYCPKTAES